MDAILRRPGLRPLLFVLLLGCGARRELHRGEQALRDGHASTASRSFQSALSRKPGDPRALYGLARAAMMDGRPQDAVTPARTAWELGLQDAGPVLAEALLQIGRGAEARPVLAALPTKTPGLALLAANVELSAGDFEAAQRALQPALTDDAEAPVLALAAWICARREDSACATSLAGRASSMGQDDADIMSDVAAIMRAAGARAEAQAAATRAVTALRARPQNYARDSKIHAQEGDLEGALRLAARARALDPSDGVLAADLGELYLATGSAPRAIAELSAALALDPYKAPIHTGGVSVARPNDMPEADRLAGNAHILKVLAEAQLKNGDLRASATALQESLRLRASTDATAWSECATRWRKAGDINAAIEALRQAVELVPGSAALNLNLARTLVDAKRPTEALTLARRAWEIEPGSVDAALLTGLLHENRGENRAAQSVYAATLAMHPGDPRLTAALRRAGGYTAP